ncbi:MAG: J domain-containing protein [Spirochaetota bacterium]
MRFNGPGEAGPVPKDRLLSFLAKRRGRVDESELLREFVSGPEAGRSADTGSGSNPDSGPEAESSIALFRRHFELYHALYCIENAFAEYGLKLHIGLAHVTIHELPEEGLCRYFDQEFCREPCAGAGASFCATHLQLQKSRDSNGAVGRASMRAFYLDRSNLDGMDSDRLEMLMRGVGHYASNYEDIEAACALLGVDRACSSERLRRRFRYLSKLHHPDSGGDTELFSRIQDAYERLLRFQAEFSARE